MQGYRCGSKMQMVREEKTVLMQAKEVAGAAVPDDATPALFSPSCLALALQLPHSSLHSMQYRRLMTWRPTVDLRGSNLAYLMRIRYPQAGM